MPPPALGRRGAFVCACATFACVFACNTDDASQSDGSPTNSVSEETDAETGVTTETDAISSNTEPPTADTEDALCERGCVATLAAQCPNGPKTQPECVEDCKTLAVGSCAAPYDTFRSCADGETLTCNAMGIPTVLACSDQQQAFFACLNGGN